MPCFVPKSEHGIYTRSMTENGHTADTVLNETTEIQHNEVVEFSCTVGYNVQGPANLKCWHGQWAVSSLPDCTPGK